jgi:predicted transcriptional regulator
MTPAGVILTKLCWLEEALKRSCSVYHFHPNSHPEVEKLPPGSVCLLADYSFEGEFVGEFTVKSVQKVAGEKFAAYAERAIDVEEPFPKPGEYSWIIEFENLIKYDRPVKLSNWSTLKILIKRGRTWAGFIYLESKDASRVVEAVRMKAKGGGPSHEELVIVVEEIGRWLGFVVKREEETPDGLYRVDVTWRDAEGHLPLKAFEVERSRDVDKALSRLLHARHKWNCDQLWLEVGDEASADRARLLVKPMLEGSFATIRDRVRVLGWRRLYDLYLALEPYLLRNLLKRLSER